MMKKKELLNEIMGVPKALTPWVNALSQIVFDDVNKMVDWDEQGPVNYVKDGEEVEGMAYRLKKKEISGDEEFTALGFPAVWVPFIRQKGYNTIEELKEANPNKLANDLNGLRKKNKLDIPALNSAEVSEWLSA